MGGLSVINIIGPSLYGRSQFILENCATSSPTTSLGKQLTRGLHNLIKQARRTILNIIQASWLEWEDEEPASPSLILGLFGSKENWLQTCTSHCHAEPPNPSLLRDRVESALVQVAVMCEADACIKQAIKAAHIRNRAPYEGIQPLENDGKPTQHNPVREPQPAGRPVLRERNSKALAPGK